MPGRSHENFNFWKVYILVKTYGLLYLDKCSMLRSSTFLAFMYHWFVYIAHLLDTILKWNTVCRRPWSKLALCNESNYRQFVTFRSYTKANSFIPWTQMSFWHHWKQFYTEKTHLLKCLCFSAMSVCKQDKLGYLSMKSYMQ